MFLEKSHFLAYFLEKHKNAASIISAYCILIKPEEINIMETEKGKWIENNYKIIPREL